MRLDKFLKLSRIIKRRSVANEACNLSRIYVNGKAAKPSKTINAGDELAVSFGTKMVYFEVLFVPEGNIGASKADDLYKVEIEPRYIIE